MLGLFLSASICDSGLPAYPAPGIMRQKENLGNSPRSLASLAFLLQLSESSCVYFICDVQRFLVVLSRSREMTFL